MTDFNRKQRENPLSKMLSPASVAVAGASVDPRKMGSIIYLNLARGGFTGEVFVVHPIQKELLGTKAYPSPEKLPHAPELAVLVVPTAQVCPVLEGFGKIGTRHAIIVTAGFGEVSGRGGTLQDDLMKIAEKYRMRILGPNCLGVINAHNGINTTAVPTQDKPGPLSIASQSGSYVAQTLSYLKARGIRLSKAISVGNEADIDLTHCLQYLADDPETRAIGLYIESIRDGGRFLEAARNISREKPIIAQYVGGTRAGAKAGASHTGAMAGPDYLYDGLFEQAGIIRVETMEEVFAAGNALALCPELAGERIGILTNSGGPGTGMATTLDRHGLKAPDFSRQLRERLEHFLPAHANAGNPVDLTFHVGMELLADKLPETLLQSDEIDGLLIHGVMDTGFMEMLYPIFKDIFDMPIEQFNAQFHADLKNLSAMPEKYKKPIVLSSFMGREDHALVELHENGMPAFSSPEAAAKAMAALHIHHRIKERPKDSPNAESGPVPEKARKIMASATRENMDEFTAKEVLRAFGIPTCRERLADSFRDAVAAAQDIGYPVIAKACAPQLAHKSDRGLVRANLRDDKDVETACQAIRELEPSARFLICEMLPTDREFMAGMTRFDGFPPAILFGLGGIFTETLKDFSVRLAPFGKTEASRLIQSIRAKALLEKTRGLPPANIDALCALLVRLGKIALHFDNIREIDVNPILMDQGVPKVADALFVLE